MWEFFSNLVVIVCCGVYPWVEWGNFFFYVWRIVNNGLVVLNMWFPGLCVRKKEVFVGFLMLFNRSQLCDGSFFGFLYNCVFCDGYFCEHNNIWSSNDLVFLRSLSITIVQIFRVMLKSSEALHLVRSWLINVKVHLALAPKICSFTLNDHQIAITLTGC